MESPPLPSKIRQFLKELDLECYANNFEQQHISIQMLAHLSDHDFKASEKNIKSKYLPKTPPNTPGQLDDKSLEMLNFKIIVVGDGCTGKTSLVTRYSEGYYTGKYKTTIGYDFSSKVVERWDLNLRVTLYLWDLAGQDRFIHLSRAYYKEAVGALIVFDVTDQKTFQSVKEWKKDIDSKVSLPGGKKLPCVLLANKSDLADYSLCYEEHLLDQFCKENDFVAWFKTSAKTNTNVSEAMNHLVDLLLSPDYLPLLTCPTEKRIQLDSPLKENSSKCC